MAFRQFTEKLNRLAYFTYQPPDMSSESFTISLEDVAGQLGQDKVSGLFLGYFTREQIETAFTDTGIFEKLQEKQYEKPALDLITKDRFEHRMNLYADLENPDDLIGQIVLRTGMFHPKGQAIPAPEPGSLSLLFIEWILMQDIRGQFTPSRPMLPGQKYPGLGVGRQVVRLLKHVTRTLHLDGILNCPEHFHNGHFYQTYGQFHFFNPRTEATLDAIKRDTDGLTISDQSHAVHLGCIRSKETGEVFQWKAEEQIRPSTQVLKDYFESRDYRRSYRAAFDDMSFELDRDLLARRKELESEK